LTTASMSCSHFLSVLQCLSAQSLFLFFEDGWVRQSIGFLGGPSSPVCPFRVMWTLSGWSTENVVGLPWSVDVMVF
jgi:hypothetical protein